MSKDLTFVAIYKTNFVEGSFAKVVSHPVKVEFFKGTRSYQIPVLVARKFPKSEERTVSKAKSIILDDAHYIEIKTRTKLTNAKEANLFCESEIDKMVSMLSVFYGFHLFDELVYKGWIIDQDRSVLGGWMQILDEQKFTIHSEELSAWLQDAKKLFSSNSDFENRFILMSRFLSKSLSYDVSEEKFILLWTALEVFPMKNTTNIEPISILLSRILQRDIYVVKNQLEIGKLYGVRCALVHEGKFKIDIISVNKEYDKNADLYYEHGQSHIVAKLEHIVREIMRNMCGLEYSGSLEQYFNTIN